MLSIAWSLALGIITSQLTAIQPPKPFPREAVKLYRQALVLADSETPNLAFTVLEQLCESHPNSPLAAISALRIAEARFAAHDFQQALLILLTTVGKQSDVLLSDVQRIDPKFESQLKILLQQIIAQPASQAQFDSLETWLKESNSREAVSTKADDREPSTLQVLQSMLVDEVSLTYARRGQFRRAIEVLDQSPSPLTEAQQRAVQLELPLALLKSKPTQEEFNWLLTRLSTSSMSTGIGANIPTSGRIALQLALGDAQRQRGNIDQAIETFTNLSLLLRELIAKQAKSGSDQALPNSSAAGSIATNSTSAISTEPTAVTVQELSTWLATATLRKAELLLLDNQTNSALQLSEASLNEFPQYASANQFRFLIARCQIAQIEFESAKQTLNLVVQSTVANRETDIAQAWWMLGEVDFLQRNYREALQKYAQVVEVQTSTAWHARALFQAGKCYELLGAPLDALSSYQRVANQYPQSEVSVSAQVRIQQLTNLQSSTKTQAVNPTQSTSTISR